MQACFKKIIMWLEGKIIVCDYNYEEMFGKKIFVMVMNIEVHEKYGYNACINLIINTFYGMPCKFCMGVTIYFFYTLVHVVSNFYFKHQALFYFYILVIRNWDSRKKVLIKGKEREFHSDYQINRFWCW